MPRRTVMSDAVARPVGPFAAGAWAGDILFLSGQVAQEPRTRSLTGSGVEEQTEQVLNNVTALLRAAGKTLDEVVRVSVFLTTMSDFAQMNAVYARHFTEPYPARTTVAVAGLPLGALVEIEVVAG
jgi:2-iminobutanoate/2-iminopropanoate deaminase